LDDVLGPGEAQLTWDLLVRRADGTTVHVEDPGGRLEEWLRRGRAHVVTVRPDRIVRSATPVHTSPRPGRR
jgi:3-(3-hydroxy-phenyl)propionate hydroxylase